MENLKHRTQIQVRFKDIDALGHVNNANHLSYIENARVQYFEDLIGANINWSDHGIILARVEVDYKMPILLKDKVFVYTGCIHIGNKSFTLGYRIVKEENNSEVILAEAKSVQVCYDYKKKAPMPMPEQWRKLLA